MYIFVEVEKRMKMDYTVQLITGDTIEGTEREGLKEQKRSKLNIK